MDVLKFKAGLGVITQPIKTNYYGRGNPASDSFWNSLDDVSLSPAGMLSHYKHWVYDCASKNATAVATVPLKLYVNSDQPYPNLRKGIDTRKTKFLDVEEVTSHPFLELMKYPNPLCDSWFEFIELMQLYLELTGDAYVYVYSGAVLGTPAEIYVLPSQYVRVVPSKTKFVAGYLYGTTPQNAKALKPEEVIHLRFANPSDLFYGKSPLEACFSSILRKEAMDEYEHALLKNNARPDFLLIPKGRYTEEQARSLRNQWQQLYGNKYGRGKPAVATGDMDVKELAFNPREMAFLQGRKATKEEVFSSYGVPLTKSDPNQANRASAQVSEVQYQRDTIKPRLIRIADKFNGQLINRYDTRLFVKYDENIPDDREMLAKEREIYVKTGILTRDEVRETMDMPPLEKEEPIEIDEEASQEDEEASQENDDE